MDLSHALKNADSKTASDADLKDRVAKMDAISRAAIKSPDGETQYTNVWQATLRRHGQRISRTFSEARRGGREAALAMAQAWRDAVIEAIPPITNHQAATRLSARNSTGISGVCRNDAHGKSGGTLWIATLTTKDGLMRRAFSVSAYGEDGARTRAIAQRQDWLNQLPPRYLSMCDTSRAAFADVPGPTIAPSVAPVPLLKPAEIKTRVAVINADFDSRMPKRLRWRVRAQSAAKPNGPIVLVISDAGFPARRQSRTISPRSRLLSVMLIEILENIRADTADLYGEDIADWFVRTYAAPALTPERFNPVVGFKGCLVVPQCATASLQ